MRVREREKRLNETDPDWVFKERERQRLKQAKKRKNGYITPRGTEKHSFKKKATTASKRIPCPDGSQRHHWSYNKEHWRDVFILTYEEHLKIHRYMIFDSERKMYRRLDGLLLDSRDSSENYYSTVFKTEDGKLPVI